MPMFQLTATRRWLPNQAQAQVITQLVSTHSHPEVAAFQPLYFQIHLAVSTHSHPEVAAVNGGFRLNLSSGFNSQPPGGGCGGMPSVTPPNMPVSTHSHPEVAAYIRLNLVIFTLVSTHSHPEVAARCLLNTSLNKISFNSQPPGGGCRKFIK
ncbi:hypothetical protein F544_14480 [Bibersteinia trehalosi USDA-ARS-USMARC-190]|uniref:Uncharacterized protein n=1 Tax=Bibersteinia trehalosi USDA-ARS-USMARC-190 TaxID=1263832 RepID=W0R7C7_BIBTR|nr:hypothetical protein F544_14480 [Bibersteinia trehalosi USDA-ARS-USMARC-190]